MPADEAFIHDRTWSVLLDEARRVRELAYAPYSKFAVGAAVLTSDGRIFCGCNVENASYGATQCAERTALFSAIAAGVAPKSFVALVVIANTSSAIPPCGLCRQVFVELCSPEMPVLMANLSGESVQTTVAQLMPFAFGRENLN